MKTKALTGAKYIPIMFYEDFQGGSSLQFPV